MEGMLKQMQDLIEGLNDKQREAVLQTEGPCLVIAGAGSGKTKVLTHKIAYLMSEKNVAPWNILAITFTNKAAKEMKDRIENLVGDAVKDMWIGTFHSIYGRRLHRGRDPLGADQVHERAGQLIPCLVRIPCRTEGTGNGGI